MKPLLLFSLNLKGSTTVNDNAKEVIVPRVFKIQLNNDDFLIVYAFYNGEIFLDTTENASRVIFSEGEIIKTRLNSSVDVNIECIDVSKRFDPNMTLITDQLEY